MKFKDNLKAIRESKKLTIQKVADAIQVRPYTISDWETGRSEPSISNLIKLSKLFNVSLDFLVGNELKIEKTYEDVIKVINDYQSRNCDSRLEDIMSGLSLKKQEKLLNVLDAIRREMYDK